MTYGDIAVLVVLGLMVGSIIGGMFKDKKEGKKGCGACPHYSTCRAHIGCSNNPENRK